MEHYNETTSTIPEEINAITHNLEALQVEHAELLVDFSASHERGILISKNIEMIQQGLGDAQMLLSLTSYLDVIDTNNQKLHSEMAKLTEENEKLRRELNDTQQKLRASEQKVAEFEENKKTVILEKHVRQCDPDLPVVKDPVTDLLPIKKSPSRRIYEWRKSMNRFILPIVGLDNEDYQHTLCHLSLQYGSQGRYEVAVPLCKQAIEELVKAYGYDHPDVAEMMIVLALVYRDQNRNEEATKLLHKALAIQEKIPQVNEVSIAQILNDIGMILCRQGKFEEAESLLKRVMEINERQYGPNRNSAAKEFNNIAVACMNQGKFREAVKYCHQVLEICRKKNDLDNPVVEKAIKVIRKCLRSLKSVA